LCDGKENTFALIKTLVIVNDFYEEEIDLAAA